MGCGASSLAGRQQKKEPPRQNDDIVKSIRAVSEFNQDLPLAIGALVIFDTKVRNVKEDYAFGKILGKGQFGTCRLVTEKSSGTRFACKSIAKRRLASAADVEDVQREVQIMHHLAGHPNIVTIKDVYEDRSHVHIVEELCSGGELFDSIVERGHYSERDAASVFRCIVSVIAHCHNMGVMHRDIKPENFLLSNRSKYATVKGTDFGLSCFFSEGQMFNEVVGSAFYVAPEVLRKRYDKRADIWSLGVLLYILLCGMPPFYAETEKDIFRAILNSELSFDSAPWPSISEAAKDVIRRMLDRNPGRRATAAEVLAHEWVRENGSAAAAPLNNEVLHRLQNFAALNKLQQEALKVIATHLPENEISGLKALFQEMDADGSGTITVEELREALRKKGTKIPAAELERIMAQADISGDGTLDYEEFLAATMNLAKLEHEEHLYMAFRFFDTDDSGYITREELTAALHRVCSQGEIDLLLAQADSSGDGRIDYEEFCDLMRSGNAALAKATKTVKQGLMRTVRSQAVLDLAKLNIEPSTPRDGSGHGGGDGRSNANGGDGGDGGDGGGGNGPTSTAVTFLEARDPDQDDVAQDQLRGGSGSAAAFSAVSFVAAGGSTGGGAGAGGGAASPHRRSSGHSVHGGGGGGGGVGGGRGSSRGSGSGGGGSSRGGGGSGSGGAGNGSPAAAAFAASGGSVTLIGGVMRATSVRILPPLAKVSTERSLMAAAAATAATATAGGGAGAAAIAAPVKIKTLAVETEPANEAAVLLMSDPTGPVEEMQEEMHTLVEHATPRRLQFAVSAETAERCRGALSILERSSQQQDMAMMAAVSFKSTVGG